MRFIEKIFYAIKFIISNIFRRKENVTNIHIPPVQSDVPLSENPDSPVTFGYKTEWLCVKTTKIDEVVNALNLTHTKKANWQSGLNYVDRYYDTHVFVSPAVQSWIFVIGIALHGPDNDGKRLQEFSDFVTRFGKTFPEFYYFGSHRIVGYHAWVKVINGKVIRGYAYLGERGETLYNIGKKTEEENELDFDFFDDKSPDAENEKYWDREDLRSSDEEDVIKIAEKWSLNPLTLNQFSTEKGVGIIGKIKEPEC